MNEASTNPVIDHVVGIYIFWKFFNAYSIYKNLIRAKADNYKDS